MPRQLRPQSLEVRWTYLNAPVGRVKALAHELRPRKLIKPSIAETCREGLDPLTCARARHHRDQETAVQAAAEVGTHRHIRDEGTLHGREEHVVNQVDGLSWCDLQPVLCTGQRPVALHPNPPVQMDRD